jgi:transposase
MAMLQDSEDTEEIIERVAALDIGKAELVACVRVPNADKPGRRAQEITTYSTMTRSLLGLADRLRELGVTRVVMEATSVGDHEIPQVGGVGDHVIPHPAVT